MKGRHPSRGGRPKARPAVPARTAELTVATLGARGDGLATLNGETVFIPHSVPGDRVLARIDGRRGDGLTATIIELLEAGPGRVAPPCPHFGQCGGCAVQRLDAAPYAAWKRDLLVTPLARAGLGEVPVGALVRVEPGSRRRATFAFLRRKAGMVLGFNGRASHAVIDIAQCLLLDPALSALLDPLRQVLAQVVPEGGNGDVTATLTDSGLDVTITAEARLGLPERERLAAFAEAADLARLSWRQSLTSFAEPVARRRAALVRFADVAVEPPPGGFLQPTREGERTIAALVAAAVGEAEAVADLFSGCGSFTFPLARAGRSVHAVEGEAEAIRALDAAARRDRLPVSAEVRDLARRPLLAAELKRFQAVVFDPPRAGAAAQAEHLAQAGPPVVVAVSCNPATLARDLKILTAGGYGVSEITPIDQFAFSPHLEAVAVLRR